MPTRRGRILLIAALACYVLARRLAASELYPVVAAGVLLPLLAVAAVRWGRFRMSLGRSVVPPRLFAGESTVVRIVARNAGRMPSPPVQIESKAPAALGGPVRFVLPPLRPGRVERLEATRRPVARGRYRLGPLEIVLQDPFGLASVRTRTGGETGVVVYPRIEPLGDERPASGQGRSATAALHGLSRAGDEFYAVRAWQEGDDLRRIHWRSVARTGELMIRQDEARMFPRTTVLIDTRATAHQASGVESSLEWTISAAASAVWHLAREGFALDVATPDLGGARPRAGIEAAHSILETLAGLGTSRETTLAAAIRHLGGTRGGSLLAIVTPPDPADLARLAHLRSVYAWCGAVIVDPLSFGGGGLSARAAADQRIADAERVLIRAGWRATPAGSRDRFQTSWRSLFQSAVFRPSSPSSPS